MFTKNSETAFDKCSIESIKKLLWQISQHRKISMFESLFVKVAQSTMGGLLLEILFSSKLFILFILTVILKFTKVLIG